MVDSMTSLMTADSTSGDNVDINQAALMLGPGVTPDHLTARIRRGTMNAVRDDRGDWRIPISELRRLLDDLEPCSNCEQPAASLIIVKYHGHQRVEFTLCDGCAAEAERAYARKDGVLEIRRYPLLGEGWINP